MGNDMSHQPYLVRQISQTSGKDEAAIQDFYSSFQKECPSGHMTPEDFSKLYSKVALCFLFPLFPPYPNPELHFGTQQVFSSGEAQDLRSKAFGAFSKNGNTIDFRDFVMVIVIK